MTPEYARAKADPEWQEAWQEYVAVDHAPVTSTTKLLRRIDLIGRLKEIESRYEASA